LPGSREDQTCSRNFGDQRQRLLAKVCFDSLCIYLYLNHDAFMIELKHHLVIVIFFSVLQGSVGVYCLHHCKAAPIVIVPGKGLLSLPYSSFFNIFLQLIF